MDYNITSFFKNLIEQSGSYDIAESEFWRMISEDQNLKSQYQLWCDENGYSERTGFSAFCEDCMKSQDSVWDSLNDFDE